MSRNLGSRKTDRVTGGGLQVARQIAVISRLCDINVIKGAVADWSGLYEF